MCIVDNGGDKCVLSDIVNNPTRHPESFDSKNKHTSRAFEMVVNTYTFVLGEYNFYEVLVSPRKYQNIP